MRALIAAAVLLSTALPATAQDFYESAGGGWSVLGLNDGCLALNRSVIEFNAAPYNALGFHQPKGTDLPHL